MTLILSAAVSPSSRPQSPTAQTSTPSPAVRISSTNPPPTRVQPSSTSTTKRLSRMRAPSEKRMTAAAPPCGRITLSHPALQPSSPTPNPSPRRHISTTIPRTKISSPRHSTRPRASRRSTASASSSSPNPDGLIRIRRSAASRTPHARRRRGLERRFKRRPLPLPPMASIRWLLSSCLGTFEVEVK